MAVETGGISCCFDRESERMLEDFHKNGLGDTSEAILDSIGKERIAGATVLELGCGFGALTLEFIRRGARSAVGVDLSPKMLHLGRSLADEAGFSRSVSFELGDGAVADLGRSDIVVLDAVLCCYPGVASLVDNSSSAAGRYYAFAIPDDGRFATRLLRLVLPLQRVMLRRKGFRFFIHPVRRIRQRLEARGFKLVSRKAAGWMWSVFLFEAPGAP